MHVTKRDYLVTRLAGRARSHFCRREFISDGLTRGMGLPVASPCFIPETTARRMKIPSLPPLRGAFLARLIIIFRVTHVKIPILLLPHGIYRVAASSSPCQQVAHCHFVQTRYKVHVREGRDKEYITRRYRDRIGDRVILMIEFTIPFSNATCSVASLLLHVVCALGRYRLNDYSPSVN